MFWDVFLDVPVLGFILDSGGFAQDKTGLFGAVWIENRDGRFGNRKAVFGIAAVFSFCALVSFLAVPVIFLLAKDTAGTVSGGSA